jgi:hypothetical protein
VRRIARTGQQAGCIERYSQLSATSCRRPITQFPAEPAPRDTNHGTPRTSDKTAISSRLILRVPRLEIRRIGRHGSSSSYPLFPVHDNHSSRPRHNGAQGNKRLRPLLVLLAGRGNPSSHSALLRLSFSASRQRNHAPPRYLGSTPALLIPRLKHGPSKGRSKDCAAPPTRDGSKRYFLRSATSPGQQAADPPGHHPITTTQPRPPPESPDYNQSHNKRMLVHSSVI